MFFTHFNIPFLHSIISKIFETWITQPGYPLITVHPSNDPLTFKLTQNRFILEPNQNNKFEDNIYWNIPFDITIKFANKSIVGVDDTSNVTFQYIFPDQETFEFKVTDIDSMTFYLINSEQRGHYRVHYDDKNWNEIKKALNSSNFGGIHHLTRAQIVDDLFHLTEAGYLKYDFLMETLEFLKEEEEYVVWKAVINGFDKLSFKLPQGDIEKFRTSFKVRSLNKLLPCSKLLINL